MTKNKNSIIGTYHTNLRNVGLYSSISIALLSFSNNGVLKKDLANNVLFGLGVVFLLVSFILSKELKEYSEKNKEDISERLLLVSKIINYTIIIFLTAVVYSVLHRVGVF
jgi:small-conductance mechanosensitive channel